MQRNHRDGRLHLRRLLERISVRADPDQRQGDDSAGVALLSFRSSYGAQWDAVSTGAFMVSLPVIVFAFFMQRCLVEGLTMGAVK